MMNELSEFLSFLIALVISALVLAPGIRRAHRNRAALRQLSRVGSEAKAVIRRNRR